MIQYNCGKDIYNNLYREAIDVFARASRSGKRLTQLNETAFSCRLRESAYVCGKK